MRGPPPPRRLGGEGVVISEFRSVFAQAYNARTMTVTPGTRIGPYEIRAAIGEGGMGKVYRAHDSRLGRDVAVKISAEQIHGMIRTGSPRCRARRFLG